MRRPMNFLGLSKFLPLVLGLTVTTIGIGLTGCDPAQQVGSAPEDTALTETNLPTVVVTSTVLASLAEEVGGEEVQIVSLLDPGDDPHIYEPVPQDTIALEKANLIFYNGFNLEPGLIRLIEGAGINAEKVALGEVVQPLSFQYQGQTAPDPHVWGDVKNAIAMVEAIRDSLIELDPDSTEAYTENAETLAAELSKLDLWIQLQMETIPEDQRLLVTTHDAFQYYAAAYGLEIIGTLIGISTEEQPSAQTLQKLVEAIKAAGVPAIFAETTINPQLIQTVAEEAQVNLAPNELYSDSIGAPGSAGDSYLNMMVANTETIVTALEGDVLPFNPNQP